MSVSTSEARAAGAGDEHADVAASGDEVAPLAVGALGNACATDR